MNIESDKIKIKIEKLLSLAQNNNQPGEMEAALLKAQELMYKYNISYDKVNESNDNIIESVIIENVTKNNWKYFLALVIADNFKCFTFRANKSIKLFGRYSDVSIAQLIFNYGIVDITVNQSSYKTINDKEYYAHGFIDGLKEKFKKQVQNFGLIITKDSLVTQEYDNIRRKYNIKTIILKRTLNLGDSYNQGFNDGKNAYTSNNKAIERR